MSTAGISDEVLTAYLHEQLGLTDLVRVETALREDETLRRRAAALAMRRDLPYHSVGSIWRTERLSCPGRDELGAYLLGTIEDQRADYISFHHRVVGCRYCSANLADLQARSRGVLPDQQRRRRYFESSAGHLGRDDYGDA